jgi:predicted acylesterase/phospholipase RssA
MNLKKLTIRALCLSLALAILSTVTTGCGALRPRNPVPESLVYKAELPDFGDIRITLDPHFSEDPKGYTQQVGPFFQSVQKAAAKDTACCRKELVILSLSGGGEDGAFGAGILNGWTASGTRPSFDIVTGISTGALQAPFAFLGKEYDDSLKVYSTIHPSDVFRRRPLGKILQVRDAVADFTPLSNLIARLFGKIELGAVAREYNRGRLLLIGTTNLEAQQLVIWNMGAIAASGHPDALNLFRKVMIASASIPVAVPPVYFNVEVDGQRYDEMHVDGGVITQVYGVSLLKYAEDAWRKSGYKVTGRVFIIRNSHMSPEWGIVEPRLTKIAGRSMSTLIKNQGLGDIWRAYAIANVQGYDFNHIAIPMSYDMVPKEPFDPEYMKALYKYGFEMARDGLKWDKHPLFYTPPKK